MGDPALAGPARRGPGGIRSVKDAPKRAQAARELARKVGVEIKEVYLTSGDDDLLVIVDTPT